MNTKEAREHGRRSGRESARGAFEEALKETQVGYRARGDDVVYFERDYLRHLEDKIGEEASEGEEHSRQFSPFEHLASEMNSDEDRADDLWSAYEDGVAKGIASEVKRLLRGQRVKKNPLVGLRMRIR